MLYTDQLGNKIELKQKPKRIVSLVPSQSEFLWDIGLKTELVGITKFCIHPKEMFDSVNRIGGTKQLDISKIKRLQPDLIIGNKEENVKEQIEILQNQFPVWMSDVNTLDEAYEMMLSLGILCGKEEESTDLVTRVRENMISVKDLFSGIKVAYFIWNKPYMVAASYTYINSVLTYAGFENVFQNQSRYPEISIPALEDLKTDLLLLSSEPYPFTEKHCTELHRLLPDAKVMLADGEMFSWYGSRLVSLPDYLLNLKERLL